MSAGTKVNIKIQQIARLRVAGIKDDRICELFSITRSGLSRILTLQEYKDEESAILDGTVSKMDEALAGRAEEIKQVARVGVPSALRSLIDIVNQRRDLRACLAAAKELLDRDPDRTLPSEAHAAKLNQDGTSKPAFGGLSATIMSNLAQESQSVADGVAKQQAQPVVVQPIDPTIVN